MNHAQIRLYRLMDKRRQLLNQKQKDPFSKPLTFSSQNKHDLFANETKYHLRFN